MKLFIYGEIGPQVSAIQVASNLQNLQDNEELTVHINSPGGEVYEGYAIYNLIASVPNKVTTVIDGLCGSISTLIALAADEVQMSEAGRWMIHNAQAGVRGDHNALREGADILQEISTELRKVYAAKTGMDAEELQAFMDKELDIGARKALEFGFVDAIVNPLKAVAYFSNQNNLNFTMSDKKTFQEKVKDVLVSMSPKAETSVTVKSDTTAEAVEVAEAAEGAVQQQGAPTAEEVETTDGETVDAITRAEFEAFQAQVMELLQGITEEEEEVAPTPEEEEEEEEALIAKITDRVVTAINPILGEAVTKGATPVAQSNLSPVETPKTMKFSGFREKMKAINSQTRN